MMISPSIHPSLPSTAAKAGDESASPRDSTAATRRQEQAELQELARLKARDREVRAHEQAHQSVGGQYASAPSYTYQRGPDGVQYAVGGEVNIDIAPVADNPQATIDKMRTVRAAALAPAEPSGQDRAVAAEAMQLMMQAQQELAQDREGLNQRENGDPSREPGGLAAYRTVSGLSDPDAGTSSDPFLTIA
ncbi:MAG: putative metalloprotease CJM1_0395 family protein [Marinobacter sp.]|uniref:putative metalloprotease CJM1_0395 family protein n=1 Tax=Marinobacter sp. TaxID=50741 RepID=UPI00299ED5A9|nr:putative metalloprotease CJM1_0395 family protein [Marinobacter sp.]MDX1756763.1 putative metalloprotease CJM1_0395 family protein [Marinobacter sp.]